MGELISEMKNNKKYHRRSIRLKGHNYSSSGEYFVTICAKNRRCLFGNIVNDKMVLNDAGMAAERCLRQIPKHYPNAIIDEHIVMPNHVHIIINIVGARHAVPLRNERFGKPTPGSLSTIVRSYKSAVTKQINELRNKHGLIAWQRNYYEHVIRNESELIEIQEYILNNPKQWESDIENVGARHAVPLQNPLRI